MISIWKYVSECAQASMYETMRWNARDEICDTGVVRCPGPFMDGEHFLGVGHPSILRSIDSSPPTNCTAPVCSGIDAFGLRFC